MKITNYKVILIGLLLSICLWIFEAALDTYIFYQQSNFLNNLFFPPLHEFWMRVVVVFILFTFCILAQIIINKLHLTHKTLQKIEEELRISYNRSKFYKDLFTHDVNNIFQVLNSSAEIISNYNEKPKNSINIWKYPDIIKQQIERGSKLISNVSKLFELEEFDSSIEKVDVLNLLNQAINYVKDAYFEKEILIQIDSTDVKSYVLANKFLVDIFENILVNAIKYNKNPTTEVSIKISRILKGDGEFIKLEFKDNGIGISDRNKEMIFEKNSRSYKGSKGMGIGLSIVKRIVESYKGYIWIENNVPDDYLKGSNFVLLLPKD